MLISTFILNFLLTVIYVDGEQLTAEDEKVVAGRLLAYRPNSNDKIGCLNGVDARNEI